MLLSFPDDIKIFDSHLHIIDPAYPLIPNQGYLPESFTVANYLQSTKDIPIAGGAIVSGSFQGFDQTYLVDALTKLGPNFVGVSQVPVNISDEELAELDQAGVKALRFNLYRGGSEELRNMQNMANRIYALFGWHIELYVDAKDLPELLPMLKTLPKVCVDHLGLSENGLNGLKQFVESGGWVKASGFGRVNFHIPSVLQQIIDINPQALIFGTDLPGTRAPRAFEHDDLHIVLNAVSLEQAKNILWGNAKKLYFG